MLAALKRNYRAYRFILFVSAFSLLFCFLLRAHTVVAQESLWKIKNSGAVSKMLLTADKSKLVALGNYSEGSKVMGWRIENQKDIKMPKGEFDKIAIHPQKNVVALSMSYLYDQGIIVYNLEEEKATNILPHGTHYDFNQEGNLLATAYLDKINFWDWETGNKIDSITLPVGEITYFQWLKKDHFIIQHLTDGQFSLSIVNLPSLSVRNLYQSEKGAYQVYVTPKSKHIIGAFPTKNQESSILRVFKSSSAEVFLEKKFSKKLENINLRADSDDFLAQTNADEISAFIQEDHEYKEQVIEHDLYSIQGAWFLKEDLVLLNSYYDNQFWQLSSANALKKLSSEESYNTSQLVLIPEKELFIIDQSNYDEDSRIISFSIPESSPTKIAKLVTDTSKIVLQRGHSVEITSLAFHPNGKHLISGDAQGDIVIWDLLTRKELRRISSAKVNDVYGNSNSEVVFQINKKSGVLAVSNGNRTGIDLIDPLNGQLLNHLSTKGIPGAFSFSDDGNFFAVAHEFATLRIYKIEEEGFNFVREVEYNSSISQIISKGNFFFVDADNWQILYPGGAEQDMNFTPPKSTNALYSAKFHPTQPIIYGILGQESKGNMLFGWNYLTGESEILYESKYPAGIGTNKKGELEWSPPVLEFGFAPDGQLLYAGDVVAFDSVESTHTLTLLPEKKGGPHTNFAVRDLLDYTGALVQNNDYSFTATGHSNGTVAVWNTKEKVFLFGLSPQVEELNDLTVFPDGKKILLSSSQGTNYPLRIWNLETGKVEQTLDGIQHGYTNLTVDSSGTNLIGNFSSSTNITFTPETKKSRQIEDMEYYPEKVLAPNGKFYITLEDAGKKEISSLVKKYNIIRVNLNSPEERVFKTIHSVFTGVDYLNFAQRNMSPDEKHFLITSGHDEIKILSTDNGRAVKSIKVKALDYTFSASGLYILTAYALIKYNINGFEQERVWQIPENINIRPTHLIEVKEQEGIFLFISENIEGFSNNDEVKLQLSQMDLETGNVEALSNTLSTYPKEIQIVANRKVLVMWENYLELWSLDEQGLLATLIPTNGSDFLIYTPDNYYLSSRRKVSSVAFRLQDHALPFDYFDLQNNRPDLVLSKMGFSDSLLIKAYAQAYHKRVVNSERQVFDKLGKHPELISKDKLSPMSRDSLLVLNLTTLVGQPINRIHVRINGVPIYGSEGKAVANNTKVEVPLQLLPGLNQISVEATISANRNSATELRTLPFQATVDYILKSKLSKPELYMVTMSVSSYADSGYNLNYARKDGEDMVKAFKSSNLYSAVHCLELYDENVTKDVIEEVRSFLEGAKTRDVALLFVSGHGLVDDSLNFYFATHDIDFTNPAQKGIEYDQLNHLFEGIKARKKLALIDACHSGELDKDALVQLQNLKKHPSDSTVRAYAPKGAKKVVTQEPFLGLENSFELMQELFANVSRGNGATIISAAAGTEFAYEGQHWNNGVFTYSVLQGLTQKKADTNKDGALTVNELKAYVGDQVQTLTKGRQKPTSRQENLEFDFQIW